MYIYRKLRNFLIILAAFVYILFEELMWNKIAEPIYSYLISKRIYETFLNNVEVKYNRYLILILFLLFFSSSEIMGILAIGFFAKSMFLLGVVIYILKILPVIISFAILEKGKTKLFSFNWFKICYEFITNLIHKLKENKIYLTIMENISSVKEKIHNYLGNRKSVIKTLFNYSLNKNKNK